MNENVDVRAQSNSVFFFLKKKKHEMKNFHNIKSINVMYITCSTAYLAGTAYSSHLNIKITVAVAPWRRRQYRL